ncbi:MAG: hypothetical protein ACRDGA_09235, partial [Bacteroidota bacterium]
MGTDPVDDFKVHPAYMTGMVTKDLVNGLYQNHWTNTAILPYGSFGGPTKTVNVGYQEKWDALASVMKYIKDNEGALAAATWQGAKSWHNNTTGGNWSGRVTSVIAKNTGGAQDASGSTYVETGHYTASGTEYLYVVNRRTVSTESRNITLTLNNPTSWMVSESPSGNVWIVRPSGTLTDLLGPGEGRFYKMVPSTNIGSFTVPVGATINVNAGATATFSSGVNITVNGKMIANGTSTQHISLTKSGTGNWQGITLNSANGSSLQYCDFNYATIPIKATNTSNLTIGNVTIGNSNFYNGGVDDAAMAFYNSSPTINSVTINGQAGSKNGVRFASSSGGSIIGSTIQNCGAGNGIVVQG